MTYILNSALLDSFIALKPANVDLSIASMVIDTGLVGKIVLLILLVLSISSWAIMLHKYKLFSIIDKETDTFLSHFGKRGIQLDTLYSFASNMRSSPIARIFLAGYTELATQFRLKKDFRSSQDEDILPEKLDSIARTLEKASTEESTKLESYLFFLAATGSTAPFIGLFGTVWGVMEAFASIGSSGSTNISVVAPGISEALIVTAAGIFVAVPAVIGYNYFLQKAKVVSTRIDNFALDFLSMIDKIYIKLS